MAVDDSVLLRPLFNRVRGVYCDTRSASSPVFRCRSQHVSSREIHSVSSSFKTTTTTETDNAPSAGRRIGHCHACSSIHLTSSQSLCGATSPKHRHQLSKVHSIPPHSLPDLQHAYPIISNPIPSDRRQANISRSIHCHVSLFCFLSHAFLAGQTI